MSVHPCSKQEMYNIRESVKKSPSTVKIIQNTESFTKHVESEQKFAKMLKEPQKTIDQITNLFINWFFKTIEIANHFAFSVQYNTDTTYFSDKTTIESPTRIFRGNDLYVELQMIRYNLYTNTGSAFVPVSSLKLLDEIINAIAEAKMWKEIDKDRVAKKAAEVSAV